MERRRVLAVMLGLVTAAWRPRAAPAADLKKIILRVEGMT